MSLTFLLGGARSGKSNLAVELGKRHRGSVTYVATAPRLDADMDTRIDRHRSERPGTWRTIEEQVDLADALGSTGDDFVIIDCLTLWVSNLMANETADDDIESSSRRVAETAAVRAAPTVAISNEVGLSVHPPTDLGRRYRDLLGRVNQQWAATAETTLLLVAGRAIALADPWSLLPDADPASPTMTVR